MVNGEWVPLFTSQGKLPIPMTPTLPQRATPRILFVVSLCTTLLLAGCRTAAPQPKASPALRRVVILATNDFHGALVPEILRTKDSTPVPYEVGGAANLAGYVNALRSEFGDELVWLDAGDQFQGTLESNLEEGASVVRFLNHAGLSAAAIGNHEFDYGPEGSSSEGDVLGALRARIKEARYKFLSANIVEEGTSRSPFRDAPPSIILTAGGVKLGVIGLTTTETPATTVPSYVGNLQFTDLVAATRRESERLRREGAELVVVTAHVGTQCGIEPAPARVFGPSDPEPECQDEFELSRFLRALPPKTVDGVISGHMHRLIHHWIAGVPVVQGGSRGRYFNILYLYFDAERRVPVPEAARIEGSFAVCGGFFSKQADCDGSRPPGPEGRGAIVPATIHGRAVVPDQKVTELLAPTIERVAALKSRIVGNALRALVRNPEGESELGNFVADVLRKRAGTDFGMVNAYGIRAGIDAGPITYGEVYAALPFDNQITVMKVTGAELRRIMRIAESDGAGFFPISGLRARVLGLKHSLEPEDLNGDGKRERWEANRLLELTTAAGEPIRDAQLYSIALPDFLVQGGDFMSWVMSDVPADRIQSTVGSTLRDAVVEALEANGPVNGEQNPLIDPARPRIIFD